MTNIERSLYQIIEAYLKPNHEMISRHTVMLDILNMIEFHGSKINNELVRLIIDGSAKDQQSLERAEAVAKLWNVVFVEKNKMWIIATKEEDLLSVTLPTYQTVPFLSHRQLLHTKKSNNRFNIVGQF